MALLKEQLGTFKSRPPKKVLHAKARWPEVIHMALWPFAVSYAVHIHNSVPSQDNGHSKLELFARIMCETKMKENDTFGCPIFVLQNDLQGGNIIPKWSP